MFPAVKQPDAAELAAMRRVNQHIDKRKWSAAYLAVDQLRFLRAKKLDVAAPFFTMPATVASLLEYRLQRSIDMAREARNA